MLTNWDALEIPTHDTEETLLPFQRPAEEKRRELSRMQRWYVPVRRVLDFSLALVISVIAVPVIFLAALLVRLTSRGPAFYTQVRTGKGGKPFTIYKIRTMIHNCESLTGPRWTMPGDPRVTPIGWLLRRTHIDELPQLLNVLIGEMSLIGPRPERPEFVQELSQALPGYDDRHDVLPGITGLAQVQLSPDTDLESVRRKLRYDLYAIEHLSVWLDFRILVATALHAVGVSYSLLSRLRIVPGPKQVETESTVDMTNRPLHKQAA